MSKICTTARITVALGLLLFAPQAFAAEFLSTDQQVKIGQIITDQHKAAPWASGLALARDAIVGPEVKLDAVPPEAQEIAPQLRGFSYLVVEEQIALVEPQTRKIVEVIPRWRR